MADTTTGLPSWRSADAKEMEPRYMLCRDVRGATETLRLKKATYLPKFLAEDTRDWAARVAMTVVVDFFDQAVTAFVGLGLRHDPELGPDVPEEIKLDWENLDGEGNHGAMVAQKALDIMLTDGHVVLLAEYPPVAVRPRADEENVKGLRPYVQLFKVDQVMSWRTRLLGGHRLLDQLVLKTVGQEADGLFGLKTVTRYMVYRQRFRVMETVVGPEEDPTQGFVQWERWIETKSASGTVTAVAAEASGDLIGSKRIPVAVAYAGTSDGMLKSRPPLEGLAYSNVRWGQVMSDRANSLHKCGMPMPVIIGKLVGAPDGKAPSEIIMSSSLGLNIEAGGDAKILEPLGSGLEQARLELEDWEKRIGGQAVSVLTPGNATSETATAWRLTRGRDESKLQRGLRSLEDALELILQYFAEYRGLDREKIDLTIRRDFGDIVPPETLQLLSTLEEKGQLTLTRLLTELKRADLFAQDFSVEEEVEAIKREQALEPPTDQGGEGRGDKFGWGEDDVVWEKPAGSAAA